MDTLTKDGMKELFPFLELKAFRPCAYFDKHLDCIRVQVKDCSFTEIRLNGIFTLYQANHTERFEYMGFSIKGIRHLFEENHLPMAKEGPFMLAEIIDAILKVYPDFFSDLIQREFADRLSMEVEGLPFQKAA